MIGEFKEKAQTSDSVAISEITRLNRENRKLETALKRALRYVSDDALKTIRNICQTNLPCPPHKWDRDGERCVKCGDKDWMT